MPNLGVPKPPDPRPSKAHPEHRAVRKELEKKHGGYEWVPVAGLALTGLILAINVEKDVDKCEKKKEKQEKGQEQRSGRGEGSRRDGGTDSGRRRDGESRGRGERCRSLDREHDRDARGQRGRGSREPERRRIESRPRDYDYYGGGRREYREYRPWDDGMGDFRRSGW